MTDDYSNRNDRLNPYSAPRSSFDTGDSSPQLANRLRRLGARIIDVVIVAVVMLVGGFFFEGKGFLDPILEQMMRSSDSGVEEVGLVALVWTFMSDTLLTLLLVEIFTFVLLNGYLLAKRGQTIGKILLQIRIVDFYTGEVPKLRFSLVMREGGLYLLGFFGILGMLIDFVDKLVIFGESRRCLHDYWAFTKVIDV